MYCKADEMKQIKNMVLLSSIAKYNIVLNCPSGHVGMVCIANLIKVHGVGVDVDAVGPATHCSRFRSKGITDVQIIYVGSSSDAMRTAGQSNSDYKFKNDAQ